MASLSCEPFLLPLQNKKHFSWKTTKLVYMACCVSGVTPGPPEAKGQKRRGSQSPPPPPHCTTGKLPWKTGKQKVTDRKRMAEVDTGSGGKPAECLCFSVSLVWFGGAGLEPRAWGLLGTISHLTSSSSPWCFSV